MKPAAGVGAELFLLVVVLCCALLVPPGITFALYVLVAELISTYLVHCPAHYFVGRALGIEFGSIRMGKTTLARVVPGALAAPLRRLPILTLSTVKSSLNSASRRRVATMFASGTLASVGSAVVVAAAATSVEPWFYSIFAWAVALSYLAFDLIFSPRSGDLFRARRALRTGDSGPPRVQPA